MALRNWFRSRSTNSSRRSRLGVLQLEDRTVPTVGFGSSLGLGNNTGNSQARAVAIDTAGNSYLAGTFSGTTDFDPGHTHAGDTDILTARGDTDAFFAKYAPDNTLLWAQRMGGDTPVIFNGGVTDGAWGAAIDTAGNAYVTGRFYGAADFGSATLTSVGGSDGFVAKLDSSGTFQWARRWGTAADETGSGVGVDAAGNVYAAGVHVAATQAQSGIDVLKFSPSGSAVWAGSVATQWTVPPSLAVDVAGNLFVAGTFQGTVDFDPGTKTDFISAGPSASGFVLKLSSSEKLGWISPFVGQTVAGTSGFSYGQSVAVDGSGNVVVGGRYAGTVDFNPGNGITNLTTNNGGFITKLNAQGGLVWARSLDSSTSAIVNGLTVDAAGSIYATGSFSGSVDLDPGAGVMTETSAGSSDVFVLKLDSAGTFAWADAFGGAGADNGFGIAVDSSGTVYLAGSYQRTVAFDLDSTGANTLINPGPFSNAYLVKFSQR